MRVERRRVARAFGVVLLLFVLATGLSLLAIAGLGLIAFVPMAGLAVIPIQLGAAFLRSLLFQFLGLTALGAYLDAVPLLGDPDRRRRLIPGLLLHRRVRIMINYDSFFSRVALSTQGSAIRKMGVMAVRVPDMISFAPGYPDPAVFA